ncbi:MAG TPA: hypothetical protein EYN89_14435 [Flavobacteriales bacterium]|nr:hypothetical protein [Flavobacteriales bacterium]
MKQVLLSLSIVLLAIIFFGCPYDSKIALNTYEESLKLRKALYGDWTCFNGDGSKEEIQIGKGMKQVYNIRHNAYDNLNKKGEYNYYRGFMTVIKGVEILNLERKDGNYNFYKYELKSPDELHVLAIGEEYVKENYKRVEDPDLESLRAFIESNVPEPGMYEEPMRFFRNGSETFKKNKQ